MALEAPKVHAKSPGNGTERCFFDQRVGRLRLPPPTRIERSKTIAGRRMSYEVLRKSPEQLAITTFVKIVEHVLNAWPWREGSSSADCTRTEKTHALLCCKDLGMRGPGNVGTYCARASL